MRLRMAAGVLAALLAAAGVATAFLFPRIPCIAFRGALVSPGTVPHFVLTPPAMQMDVQVRVEIHSDNFYRLESLASSVVEATYDSAAQGHAVLLGRTEPSLTVEPRSDEIYIVVVALAYDVFRSSVVLGEIVADCISRGCFGLKLQVELDIAALFLRNVSVNFQTALNVSCTASSSNQQ